MPRFGPLFVAVSLLASVICGYFLFTKFFAFGAVFAIWAAWRAAKLARRNPTGYGGYRVAAATLSVAVLSAAAAGAYGIVSIPRLLDAREARRVAATEAAVRHMTAWLEEYRQSHHGSYPATALDIKKELKDQLPSDYWGKSLRYEAGAQTAVKNPGGNGQFGFNDFELRSAGPDGIMGTDDDIIFRNGVFLTNAEAKKLSSVGVLPPR